MTAVNWGQALYESGDADGADARYFELQELDPTSLLAAKLFAEARLLSAIASAFGGATPRDASDAAYELCKAREDPGAAIRAIEAALDGAQSAG